MPDVTVRAVLRAAAGREVIEALERNPGSTRLRDQGWTPAWFELDAAVDGDEGADRHFSVVWIEPGRAPADVAREELEHALDEVLRTLRDYEGIDVEREHVDDAAIDLRVEL